MVETMKKKLPRTTLEDFSNLLKKITGKNGAKFFQSLVLSIEKDNPIVFLHIENTALNIFDAESNVDGATAGVSGMLMMYYALEEAMKRMPEIITKSDNDSLPTLSKETARGCIKEYQRDQNIERIQKKIEQAKADMPGIAIIIEHIINSCDELANHAKLNSKQKLLLLGSMTSSALLMYHALKSQAENNKLKKMFGDNTSQEPPTK